MLDKDCIAYGYTPEEVEQILNRADPDEVEQLMNACVLQEKPSAYAGVFALAVGATDLGMEILERSRELADLESAQ